jgi:hypothetical protein
MSITTKKIAEILRSNTEPKRISVLEGHQELVIEVSFGARRQSVSVTVYNEKRENYSLIKLLSRACPAGSSTIVKSALATNREIGIGGLVLNMVDETAILDVKFTMICRSFDLAEFLVSLESVAKMADAIEAKIVGDDVF